MADFLSESCSGALGGETKLAPWSLWWQVLKLSFVAKSRTESKELRPATIRSTVQEFKEATADAAQQLEQLGFCFWRQGVSMDCCQRLARYVDEALLAAEAEVAAADQETRYARHRTYFRRLAHATRQDRIEFTLPMVPVVVDALKEMVASVGGLLEPFVSRSGRLVDLSCMISDPGCEFQPLHADTSMERVKFTVFVALQDVTKEMGPTFLCPETHNFESHAALDVMKKMPVPHEEMLERFGAVPALCNCGDIFIMNSQLLHCGGGHLPADLGGRRRRLLYVTWHLPGITPGEHSLRDDLVGKFRLSDFDACSPPLNAASRGDDAEDPNEAEYSRLFAAANKLDDVDAILNFAQHLREQEDQGALVWMRRAARKGHPLACLFLSEMYCLGEAPMDGPDYEKAEELRRYGMALYDYYRKREAEPDGEAEEPTPPDFLCSIG